MFRGCYLKSMLSSDRTRNKETRCSELLLSKRKLYYFASQLVYKNAARSVIMGNILQSLFYSRENNYRLYYSKYFNLISHCILNLASFEGNTCLLAIGL